MFLRLTVIVGYIFTMSYSFAAEKKDKSKGEAMAGGVTYTVPKAATGIQAPTLFGIAQTPPTTCSWRSNQLGNNNEITELPTRKSNQIADSIAGVSFQDFYSSPTDQGWDWSASWLIAGNPDPSRRDAQNCFSSEMHRSADVDEWVQVELGKSEKISRITLWPRNESGVGFPHDFQIWCRDTNTPWIKVADEKDFKVAGCKFPLEFKFKPMKARFVRVIATRLRQEGNVYYFQLSRIGVYNDKNENAALQSKGADVVAKNPLKIQTFNYDYVYNGLFDAGAKWTIISLGKAQIKRLKEKKPLLPERFIDNLDYLNKNGVQAIVRVGGNPDWLLGGNKGISKYLEILEPIVKQLKGKVGVWAILNEENMYNMYKYKAVMQRHPGATPEMWKQGYVKLVSAASDLIRKLDPGVPIEIETALFDFGWTEDVLKMGLKDKVDRIGVHVYKESPTEKILPEMVSTFIKDGKRHQPKEQPYKTYMEEINAYQKLLNSINPNIKMNVTETCVNVLRESGMGSKCMTVTEKSQAKFLARLYWLHYCYGIGPTCWWGFLNSPTTNGTAWGIHDASGRRRDAWFALRNVSAIMDDSFKSDYNVTLSTVPENQKLFWRVFNNENGDVLIPYWAMVPMRDDNTGVAADFYISGIDVQSAEVIDMLSGTCQKLDFAKTDEGFLFKKMVTRDYPLVIRIKHKKR